MAELSHFPGPLRCDNQAVRSVYVIGFDEAACSIVILEGKGR